MRCLVLMFALCAAFSNSQEFELEFMPPPTEAPRHAPNIFQAAMERMEAMSHNMAEMMENNVDASRPIKRGGVTETKEEFSPLPGVQVEIEMQTADPAPRPEGPPQGFIEMMRQRAQNMAKKMLARRKMIAKKLKKRMRQFQRGIMKRMQHTKLPQWMHKLSDKSRFFHAKRMRQAWLRKAVDGKCASDKERFCPGVQCPKKCIGQLHEHEDQVTKQCAAFLAKWDDLKAMKMQARKAHHDRMKECRSLVEDEQEACFEAANEKRKSTIKDIKTKFMQLKNDDEKPNLSEAKETHTLKGLADEAAKTFKTKMAGLETMLQGLVNKAEGKENPREKAASGCSKTSCQSGGDMGGYCKANKDCHCTAPFFSTTGTSCKLSCSPTSKTPCCRDDSDCRVGGDKDAYCKSPKSNEHTTPGNGMCRCSPGFEGTTGCKKATSEPKKEAAAMNESTPAYLTGDVEAPKGEKDMGGWTMAVYTPEQQARLGLDEVGKPAPKRVAQKEKEAHGDGTTIWPAWLMDHLLLVLGIGAVLALLMSALVVRRYRSLRQSVELRAVYNSAMTAVPTEVSAIKQGSANQI